MSVPVTASDAEQILAEEEQEAIVAGLRVSAINQHISLSTALRVASAGLAVLALFIAYCALASRPIGDFHFTVPSDLRWLCSRCTEPLPAFGAYLALFLQAAAHTSVAAWPRSRFASPLANACAFAWGSLIFTHKMPLDKVVVIAWLPASPLVILALRAAVDSQREAALREVEKVAKLQYSQKTA